MLCESASDSTCNTVTASDSSGGGSGGGNSSSGGGGGTILIHHSRNTDQKQWAETQVRFGLNLIILFEFILVWELSLNIYNK